MNTISASIAYDVLIGKYSRQELIDSIANESSYSSKLLESNILNAKERIDLIGKVKYLDILIEQIIKGNFNIEERQAAFNRFVRQKSLALYVNKIPTLTPREQTVIIRSFSETSSAMAILQTYKDKFDSEKLDKLKDSMVQEPRMALQYITRFGKDEERRTLAIETISKHGGVSLEAFIGCGGFTNEERRKLLTKITKHKSYIGKLLIQKQWSISLRDSDKEAIVDSVIETKDFEIAKIVHENLLLGKNLEDKLSPILIAGRLAGKL